MRIIKLPEPELREEELFFQAAGYANRTPFYLPIPDDFPMINFFDVFDRRETRRVFGRVDDDSLATLLWTVAKTRRTFRERSGHLWQHRGAPSAGGRHPIDLVIIPPIATVARAYIYDSFGHSFHELPHSDAIIRGFHADLQKLVPTGDGTIIWFVGQYARTLAKYQNPESLVWRDAGVLLGAIYFVAEALELNCCAYGIHADRWINQLFNDRLIGGVGGCVLGSR